MREFLTTRGASLRALKWSTHPLDKPPDQGNPTSSREVVLLHGLGDGADIWRQMMDAWSIPATVVAFDLPGHGGSKRFPLQEYSLTKLADAVATALSEHRITSPIFIGHSLGASICIHLAARPEIRTFASLLIDFSVGQNTDVEAAVSSHIDALILGAESCESLMAKIRNRLPMADEAALLVAIQQMATKSAKGWSIPLDPAIKNLLSLEQSLDPTLIPQMYGHIGIIRGAYSAVMSKVAVKEIEALFPPGRLISELVDMAGHAIPLEQPNQLAKVLANCLTRW